VKKLFSRDCAVDMDHYGSYAGPMLSNTEKLFTSGSNWNYSDFRYKKYRSTIFQDIHFISLGPPGGYCGSIINLSDKHGTLLWFEKKNGKEYQDKPGGIKFDAKDFFSLSISPAITRSVSLRIAAEHNAGSSRGQWLRLLGY